ncbi:hypothetical protein KPL44_24550 [Clostridium sp. DSM 17811]|uniref:hypothetical protein n=1 Tax=Clostridium sp. DSM 17811 TaxID=2843317 RepID=UPI001C0DC33E|nr:hypothetical protein [Clostridium sp. DSM 17811]MBU3102404.1 hypothetical protein [Clostridium sp. DSM 17811]
MLTTNIKKLSISKLISPTSNKFKFNAAVNVTRGVEKVFAGKGIIKETIKNSNQVYEQMVGIKNSVMQPSIP